MRFNFFIGFIKFLISKDRSFYKSFRKNFGFYPLNSKLYQIAFIHKSSSTQLSDGPTVNNERLEFLGDAILDAVISDYLFKIYPEKDEGFLTQMRSKIVKRKNLDYLAKKLGIQDFLITQIDKSNRKKHIYGNAFEAYLGAIYLDKGYKKAKEYIVKKILINHVDITRLEKTETDFKSRIIEWAQKNKQKIVFESFEDENDNSLISRFISHLFILDELKGEGIGFSKKEAEQKAAQEALKKIHIMEN